MLSATLRRIGSQFGTHSALYRYLSATAAQRGGCGGGGTMFPLRYDLSVNEARIENAQSGEPTIVTGTTLNTAGAFTGGGVGNKAILGFKGHSGLPLASIATVSWEWENTSPLEPGTLFRYPYINFLVELAPAGALPVAGPFYKILVIDPNQAVITPALNIGTMTALGPDHWKFDHVATADANFVQIVNAFSAQASTAGAPGVAPIPGMAQMALQAGLPPPPPPNPLIPLAAGVAPVSPATTWNNASFKWSDIVTAWPAAKLIDVYSGDGGLPGPAGIATSTPSMMLVVGDSSFRRQRYISLRSVLLNGTPALRLAMGLVHNLLRGTMESLFQVGKGGPQWRGQAVAELHARNAADNAYARVKVANPIDPEDAVTLTNLQAVQAGILPVGFDAGYSPVARAVNGTYSTLLLATNLKTGRAWTFDSGAVGKSITGVKFWWAGGVSARTITCQYYQENTSGVPVLVSSVNVAVTAAAAEYTGTFSSPTALTSANAYKNQIVTICDTTTGVNGRFCATNATQLGSVAEPVFTADVWYAGPGVWWNGPREGAAVGVASLPTLGGAYAYAVQPIIA